MTEPVACCVHGIDLCEIKAGDTVAVIGGGMIGLLMLQLA
jgi:threonine dehydrogenase-like Zn-dependent dehydrogenase